MARNAAEFALILQSYYLSHVMRKPALYICEKGDMMFYTQSRWCFFFLVKPVFIGQCYITWCKQNDLSQDFFFLRSSIFWVI